MSILSYVYSQFGKPRGMLGYVADYIMAHRTSNIERNDWALSLLSIQPTDRVLEIGFGPVIAIGKAAKNATEVIGLDRSALMVRQATRRNKGLIEAGKLRLMLGSADALTTEFGLFDKIYSMNVVGFWRDPTTIFRKLQTLLKPDGVILTAHMPRHAGAKDEDAFQKGRQIESWLRQTGFGQVRVQTRMMKPVAVVAVLASIS